MQKSPTAAAMMYVRENTRGNAFEATCGRMQQPSVCALLAFSISRRRIAPAFTHLASPAMTSLLRLVSMAFQRSHLPRSFLVHPALCG